MSAKPNTAAAHPPAKTALLLLDYQNYIVNMIDPPEVRSKVVDAATALLKAARAAKSPIFHCHIDFETEPVPTSKLTDRWDSALKPMLASNPEFGHEWPSLLPSNAGDAAPDNEHTVAKRPGCISAMKSKDIMSLLRDKYKVESIVMCGLVTSGALVSTAREAADLGFVTTAVEEGCWDRSAEAHKAIFENVLPMTAWVSGLEEALSLFQG
ncbi:hydrolase protein [Purpureocillium lavendulum]|uniref:Hydrolase protein n=1 Tax=Purpureocillium lavendulum TaxID=1247861 RepID=A0AB34FPH7_9HYPO|nr:hydrolase protein [Purpureocillium lavendulum]